MLQRKRMYALSLAVIMLMMAVAPLTLANAQEPITFTYYVGNLGNTVIQSFNDNLAYQEIMKRTGVNLEFLHAGLGQMNDQIGVMIASLEMPDIMELGGYRYPKGPDAMIEDGLILRLNELVEEYAPDYLAVINSNEEIRRQVVTDEGNIWAFVCIQPTDEIPWRGMSIRKDILDAHGKALPETIGELKECLLLFQEEGLEIPFFFNINGGAFDDGPIVSAYGVGPMYYVDEGVMKYGPMEDGYKEFLTEMHEWYELGLLDKEAPVRNGTDVDALAANGQIGVLLQAGYGPTLAVNLNGQTQNPDFQLYPIPNLPLEKGDQVQFRNYNYYNKGEPTVIPVTCSDPVEAVKFMNFGYTEEGFYLYNYGVEGVSWEMVDGKPTFTDLIVNSTEGPWTNIREKYKRHQGPYLRDEMAFPVTDFEMLCMEQWGKAGDGMCPPPVTLSASENERYAQFYPDINTYVREMRWKFITGEESLDNYDAFRDALRDMGIEEALEIQNAALTRYYDR